MASKVPTAIGQVIEGKNISVTICHECLDVSNYFYALSIRTSLFVFVKASEIVESFFDISLPMPGEKFSRVS